MTDYTRSMTRREFVRLVIGLGVGLAAGDWVWQWFVAHDDPIAQAATQDAPWALWGIDAALRAGLVPMQPEAEARFRAWVVSAASNAPGDALAALPVGTAVLLADASPDKAGFRAWGDVNSGLLLEALLPSGRARSGADDVAALGQTARMVLALQIAYRTY